MAKGKPYTVIFYVDGDRGIDTFIEQVTAQNQLSAWKKAVKQAKDDGGFNVRTDEFANATEIATFDGHLAQSAR